MVQIGLDGELGFLVHVRYLMIAVQFLTWKKQGSVQQDVVIRKNVDFAQ